MLKRFVLHFVQRKDDPLEEDHEYISFDAEDLLHAHEQLAVHLEMLGPNGELEDFHRRVFVELIKKEA